MAGDETKVVLVDSDDNALAQLDKLAAHKTGARHRAVSVIISNEHGQLLMQRRSSNKYHSGLLWANACCSHPLPGEEPLACASRRLQEELGFTTDLHFLGKITYFANVGSSLIEHEIVSLFGGRYNGPVIHNVNEVSETQWMDASAALKAGATCSSDIAKWWCEYCTGENMRVWWGFVQ
ncbi:MAG: isopentenyl-diphosphate Delta-isomerase [bacterium]|nr:isopentenyl-diphosphate Delta-isomerase [bacterium]